jgi:hypothetical protein
MTEAWAATQGIPLQIQYTIPVEQYGLDPNGEAVLQNAVSDGATVTSVDIMVFDYYIAGEGTVNMGQAAINPKFPPSRLADAFDQVVEPFITEVTCLRSHGLRLFHLVNACIGSPPGGTTD